MRRFLKLVFLVVPCVMVLSASAASGRVLKVLPQFLDLKGRHALSASLYDRDAYQAQLRDHPEQRSGMRFAVFWKARADAGPPLKLRVELRGIAQGDLPRAKTLEQDVTPRSNWSRWTALTLAGDAYKEFGDVTAWRVSLLEGDKVLSSQQSFLW